MQTGTPEKSRIRHEDALHLIAGEARLVLEGFEGPWESYNPDEKQVRSVMHAAQGSAARLVALYDRYATPGDPPTNAVLVQAASIACVMLATAEGLVSRKLSLGQHADLVDEDTSWSPRALAWNGLYLLAVVLKAIGEGTDLTDVNRPKAVRQALIESAFSDAMAAVFPLVTHVEEMGPKPDARALAAVLEAAEAQREKLRALMHEMNGEDSWRMHARVAQLGAIAAVARRLIEHPEDSEYMNDLIVLGGQPYARVLQQSEVAHA